MVRAVSALWLVQSEHRFSVAMAYLVTLFSGDVEGFDNLDGGANIAFTLLRIEGAVGSKQDVIRFEERKAADRSGRGCRRVRCRRRSL